MNSSYPCISARHGALLPLLSAIFLMICCMLVGSQPAVALDQQMSPGLGRLFMDLATIVAGRFVGGPAKVSVVSSGLFGMLSGSSIANAVTTGSLTIPTMKKYGFPPRFAAAVEASASCGGQITPPVVV